MITMSLTQGYVTFIDECDADLTQVKWRSEVKFDVYAIRTIRRGKPDECRVRLHRVILSRKLGRDLLPEELVDHVDTNTLNNCRSNLRLATTAQNTQNQNKRKNTSCALKGVTWNKSSKKWQASIKKNGKGYYLGVYDDPLDAHAAYCIKARELFGEFANFGGSS